MQEAWVRSLGKEDLLEEKMATHSYILAWGIPWTEEPGGLWSMGSRRVGHDWMTEHAGMQPAWCFISFISRVQPSVILILYFVSIAPLFKSLDPNFPKDFHIERQHQRNVYSKFLLLLLCAYTPKIWLLQLNIWNSSVNDREAGAVTESCHKKAYQAYRCSILHWVNF